MIRGQVDIKFKTIAAVLKSKIERGNRVFARAILSPTATSVSEQQRPRIHRQLLYE
jgi:hypothetical protein